MSQREIIVITESVWQSLVRDAGTCALFCALIGIGLWVGSAALQWVGAIIGFIAIFAFASGNVSRNRCTIAEARARLDRLEAGQ